MSSPKSFVQWFSDKESQRCGYCKGNSGSVQYGMYALYLSVDDYQTLIDRGWRRSGHYCYKPIMNETCCPMYTIKCNALEFSLSKSQKKVIKKLNKFLKTGIMKERTEQLNVMDDEVGCSYDENYREFLNEQDNTQILSDIKVDNDNRDDESLKQPNISSRTVIETSKDNVDSKLKTIKKGLGADPNKPPCKKAKLLRLEKKLKKKENLIETQKIKNLEDFLNEISDSDKHKLTTKLIDPTNEDEWELYKSLEFELFKKYQSIIHNDPPHKNKISGFSRFLVESPLQKEYREDSDIAYGSYHQQYWLDDKLIAVGVIDILPKCVSAVYFFYDPDYRELTLGTYGALKEIQLTRQLYPNIYTEFYYMGYYIHTCKKMRYKGNMNPSFLLCPETYNWFPINDCIEKLNRSPYNRFNDDLNAIDINECNEDDIDDIKIILNKRWIFYKNVKQMLNRHEVYCNIGKLIGKKCARSIFFMES